LPDILLQRKIISGVIVAGTNSQNLLTLLSRKGIPWVVLGNNVFGHPSEETMSAVSFDEIAGAYEVTRYLLSLGHRQIAYVGNLNLPWYARRYKGYERAMSEAGLQPIASEFQSREGEEMGYLAAKSILQQSQPTAIFAGDDSAARGVYKAIRDRGLNIPEDLSVAGFNDTPDAAALHPPLTSVHVFTDELGKQLAEVLLNRIARPDLPVRDLTLPTQVMRRESCAPVNPNHSPRTPLGLGVPISN
jgi:DNA-binding LacI/PurR family transcriptional regulator